MLEKILNRIRYKKVEGSIHNISDYSGPFDLPVIVYDIKMKDGKIIRAVNVKKISGVELGSDITLYLERFPEWYMELQGKETISRSGIKREELKIKYLPSIEAYKT